MLAASRSSPNPSARLSQPAGARPPPIPSSTDDAFVLPAHRFGNVAIGIQPARGYNIDPKTSYHDPDLVPPHSYFAFYFWLREEFGADALVHMGKHGNLEWLPGKALALSESCYPEAALGALPRDLSVHRQRSGRGRAGEAAGGRRRRRSSDAGDGARRELRAGGGARSADRRIRRGGGERPAPRQARRRRHRRPRRKRTASTRTSASISEAPTATRSRSSTRISAT